MHDVAIAGAAGFTGDCMRREVGQWVSERRDAAPVRLSGTNVLQRRCYGGFRRGPGESASSSYPMGCVPDVEMRCTSSFTWRAPRQRFIRLKRISSIAPRAVRQAPSPVVLLGSFDDVERHAKAALQWPIDLRPPCANFQFDPQATQCMH
jgi:hypothetical protein